MSYVLTFILGSITGFITTLIFRILQLKMIKVPDTELKVVLRNFHPKSTLILNQAYHSTGKNASQSKTDQKKTSTVGEKY